MSQNYSIKEATPDDIPAIVECFYSAFKDDAIVGELEKNVDPQARNEKFGQWHARLMKEAEQGLNGVKYFKAVDEEGLVLCCFVPSMQM